MEAGFLLFRSTIWRFVELMPGNNQVVLRIPPALKAKIVSEAASRDPEVSLQTIIIERLAKSFRVKMDAPKQGWKKGVKRG